MLEKRKLDHIHHSLQDQNQATSPYGGASQGSASQGRLENATGFSQLQLHHEALPELDFNALKLEHNFLGLKSQKPLLISCMTGGPTSSNTINHQLAELAERHGWLMGLGSQRHELETLQASQKAQNLPSQLLRKSFKRLKLLGNIGVAQLIRHGVDAVLSLTEGLEATALVVHTNPLQEALQPEGTPQFCGSRQALEKLCRRSPVPVILKETGCGFSPETLKSLTGLGLKAVDISGYGGTHWGRIEGARAQSPLQQAAAQTFAHWGLPTAQVLLAAEQLSLDYELWASGGLRSGLDAAKGLALGAKCAGFAQPLLKALLQKGKPGLDTLMQQIEFELKLAMFCTGSPKVIDLKGKLSPSPSCLIA